MKIDSNGNIHLDIGEWRFASAEEAIRMELDYMEKIGYKVFTPDFFERQKHDTK